MHANLCSFVLVEQCSALSNSALEIPVDPGFYVRVREEGSSNPPGRRRMTYAIKAPGIPKINQTVADPGFSSGGCANSQYCYYFAIILPKTA